jgi:mono/diheme cytochrome c family protein
MRLLFASVALLALPAAAHDPITTTLTWSREISRVVFAHCVSCHRPEGRAFPLTTYEDARPWAKAIRDEVLNRRMPPWDAVKGVGAFRNDPSLSLPELDLIVKWVEGGAPEGDPAYLPMRVASDPPSEPAAPARMTVNGTLTLEAGLGLQGIRPSGAVEVAAVLPDGEVRRLLWIRDFRPEWNRTYWFRKPQQLPKSTRLIVTGPPVVLY